MPPQTQIQSVIPPVISPTPVSPRRIWLTVLLVIGYILSVLVGVGMIGGMGIGCAFSSSGFMCQRLLPFSIGVGVLLVVLLLLHLVKSIRRIVKMTYWIIFLIWMVLIGLIAVLPDKARQTYVYGITKQACEVGKSSVPWGYIPDDLDNCFNTIGECMSMKTYSDYCFEKLDTHKITDIKECDRFENGVSECRKDFAVRVGDVSYCKDIQSVFSEKDPTAVAWERYSCANEVAFGRYSYLNSELGTYIEQRTKVDTSSSSIEVKQAKYGKEFCARYQGLQNEVCLFQGATQSDYRPLLCQDIQTDWLKAECVVYTSDKQY